MMQKPVIPEAPASLMEGCNVYVKNLCTSTHLLTNHDLCRASRWA